MIWHVDCQGHLSGSAVKPLSLEIRSLPISLPSEHSRCGTVLQVGENRPNGDDVAEPLDSPPKTSGKPPIFALTQKHFTTFFRKTPFGTHPHMKSLWEPFPEPVPVASIFRTVLFNRFWKKIGPSKFSACGQITSQWENP